MAIPLSLCIPLVFYFLLVPSYAASKPKSLLIPINKDAKSLQYYATIQMPNHLPPLKASVDLGGALLILDCTNYTSVLKREIDCDSKVCVDANRNGCHANNTCAVGAVNPFRGVSSLDGSLEEDKIKVGSTNGVIYMSDEEVEHFAFSCVRYEDLRGAARGFMGIVGLGRRAAALPNQLASLLKLQHKFALCIPSSNENGSGDLFIGGGPYFMPPYTKDLSTSFIQTPLVTNPVSTAPSWFVGEPSYEYFIGVKSVRIGGKDISFNKSLLAIDKAGDGGTKLSTIAHFTTLHSSIYKAVASKFLTKFASMNVTRVASVYPLGACFSTRNIGNSKTGLVVPIIDLVLQNDVTWRIYGHNSMKQVNREVACLAFVDGGTAPRTSIVLGGHQLENNLIEFDLVSSKLGFSNSLFLRDTSCSHSRSRVI